MSFTHSAYRPEIDGLRALAVLAVVIFHAFPETLPGGLIGVDIFFVISGYLITKILITSPTLNLHSISNFYARRVKRIFPALLITLFFSFLFGWIALYEDEFKELGLHIASGAFFISNITYLTEFGYFDVDATLKPLLHLWSLGVEEQFYLIWPILIYFVIRAKSPKIILGFILLGSFALNLYLSYTNTQFAYFFPLTRFWELFIGAYLSIEEKVGRTHPRESHGLVGILMLLIAFIFVDGKVNFPGWQALMPVIGTYLIIKNSSSGLSKKILSNKLLVGIGLISYPLYLYHWPLFSFARIVEINPSNLTIIILGVLAIFLALLTYIYIEKPIRKKNSGGWVTALSILMVIMGLLGLDAYKRNGLEFRPVNYDVYKNQALKFITIHDLPNKVEKQDKNRGLESPEKYNQLLLRLVEQLKTSNEFKNKEKEDFQEINRESYMCANSSCQKNANGKLVVIIGDSYASNLYSAFKLTHKNVAFKQFTGSGCVPIRARYKSLDNPCRVVLDSALEFVKHNQVALVIFTSRWLDNFPLVIEDINRFAPLVNKVAIVGPSLMFKSDVEKLLLRYDGQVPIGSYVNSFIDFSKFDLNDEMSAWAIKNNIPYIDKIGAFCSDGYCPLTATGDELFIFDKGHLSNSGAIYLGNKLLNQQSLSKLLN